MSGRARFGALVALTIGALAGCSDGGAESRSEDLGALRDTYEHACERAHACRDTYEGFLPFEVVFFDTQIECATSYDGFVDYLSGRVADGALSYDESTAARCRDRALDVRECDDVFGSASEPAEECDAVLVGLQMAGEGCLLDVECVSDECEIDEATSTGVCR